MHVGFTGSTLQDVDDCPCPGRKRTHPAVLFVLHFDSNYLSLWFSMLLPTFLFALGLFLVVAVYMTLAKITTVFY